MSSKDFGSVDSTIIPTSSVQSIGGVHMPDSLAFVIERFNVSNQPRVRRSVLNLIRKSFETEAVAEETKTSARKSKGGVPPSSLLSVSHGARSRASTGIPPANLLRPPRGNLICATKDLNKEFLALRKLPRAERSQAAARLVRTLDPNLPTHADLALSLFFIATL